MTKNVIVVDEKGNEYEATYPKRAKGLVKNGRARFIDENKICLACPPDITEDNMSDNTINNAAVETEPTYTVEYILGQIREIQNQTAYLNDAISKLSTVKSEGPEDIGAQAKATALADVVRCRETTNQQLIAFYQNMYERLTMADLPQKDEQSKWKAIMLLADVAMKDDEYAESRSDMLDTIRQILRENK